MKKYSMKLCPSFALLVTVLILVSGGCVEIKKDISTPSVDDPTSCDVSLDGASKIALNKIKKIEHTDVESCELPTFSAIGSFYGIDAILRLCEEEIGNAEGSIILSPSSIQSGSPIDYVWEIRVTYFDNQEEKYLWRRFNMIDNEAGDWGKYYSIMQNDAIAVLGSNYMPTLLYSYQKHFANTENWELMEIWVHAFQETTDGCIRISNVMKAFEYYQLMEGMN